MTAEESFENLGFEKIKDDEYIIEYDNRKPNDEIYISVYFNLKEKTFRSLYWEYGAYNGNNITLDLLDAINKQVEELKESERW